MTQQNGLASAAEIAPGPATLDTPYIEAQQIWDERIGSAIAAKVNAQRIAMVLAVICLCLTALVYYLVHHVTIKAYVVEVAETGQIRTVGILPQEWRGENLAPIEFIAREWLTWVRTISSDPVVFGTNLEKAQLYTTFAGWQRLGEFLRGQAERQNGGETAEIEIGNFLRIAGHARSFEIEWRERSYNQQGFKLRDEQWKGTIKIAVFPPEQIKTIQDLRNPLGVSIEEMSWGIRTGKDN